MEAYVYHTTEFENNEAPYELVAMVETDSISEAYEKTQNLDKPWSKHGKRSTSSGDVIVINDKAYFLVPFSNGRHGNKIYDSWGDTVVIDNFSTKGFIYDDVKKYVPSSVLEEVK